LRNEISFETLNLFLEHGINPKPKYDRSCFQILRENTMVIMEMINLFIEKGIKDCNERIDWNMQQ